MSTVIWAELETEHQHAKERGDEDIDIAALPDDLPHLHEALEELNEMAQRAGHPALMDLVDFSDLEYNFSEEDLDQDWLDQNAKWLAPDEVRKVISALAKEVGAQDGRQDLLEEMHHVLARCGEAQAQNTRIRLVVVM